MLNNLPTRRIGLAALAALALLPTAAMASPHAKAAQVDDRTSAGAENAITKEAWAAGERVYGPKVTADEALTAYWTPARMKAAASADDAPNFDDALKRYQATDAERQRAGQDQRGEGHQAAGAGS